MTTPPRSPSPLVHSPARPLLYALRTWLLPVSLAAAAMGVHWVLHVPAGPLPPPSPAELEEKKKAADKAKKDEEKKQREADRKAGKVRPPAAKDGARDLPYEAFNRPREQYLIDQLWEYYEPKSFKGEPTFEAWQTPHKSLLAQIISATRQLALPDGPAIVVATNECHTIRCRFTITAPDPESITTMQKALEQLELDGGSLWHSFKPGKLGEEPSKKTDSPPRHKLEITVSFMRDLVPLERIEVPGKGPLRAPPKPTPDVVPAEGKRPTPPGSTTPRPSSTGITPGARPSSTTATPPTGSAPDPKPR